MAFLKTLAQLGIGTVEHVRHHRRVYCAGANDIAAYLLRSVGHRYRSGEGDHTARGRSVGMHVADAQEPSQR